MFHSYWPEIEYSQGMNTKEKFAVKLGSENFRGQCVDSVSERKKKAIRHSDMTWNNRKRMTGSLLRKDAPRGSEKLQHIQETELQSL